MARRKKKNHLPLILMLLAVAAVVAYMLIVPVSTVGRPMRIYIDRDDNLDSVVSKLDSVQPRHTLAFRAAAALCGVRWSLNTGCYEVTPSLSLWRLVANVYRGNQTPVAITIPSTWTKEMALSKVARQLMADSASLATVFNDSTECAKYGVDTVFSATLLIPNTYELYWDIAPAGFLQRMAKERDRFWTAERTQKAYDLHLSREQVYTLASIVDAETANNAEKPTVAGLYLNRLHCGMPLQADPTVKFALRNFSLRRIYGYMLATSSPYNTYRNNGLPPGPIRIPQVSSIDAVLNHEEHNYLFMCANSDFSGTHAFAATYAEHKANATRYVQALNARGIK
ncbi:MAG: endolytic transglycosylase MltG [Prevotellaceae bacterium]|nr:endolytic transglycosylase MltG [Prevotellaceae bacterium]